MPFSHLLFKPKSMSELTVLPFSYFNLFVANKEYASEYSLLFSSLIDKTVPNSILDLFWYENGVIRLELKGTFISTYTMSFRILQTFQTIKFPSFKKTSL